MYEQHAIWLTPRESDKILLAIADRELNLSELPPLDECRSLLKSARRQARKAGMKKSDIEAAIRKVRKRS
jgi:hypothetical protein